QRTDGGMYLAPMCTPEMDTLRSSAELLMRAEGGRACVLCNSFDKFSVGTSSVLATTPTGQRQKPEILLPPTGEHLLVFEVDFEHLVLPKRTPLKSYTSIGTRYRYNIATAGNSIDFIPADLSGKPQLIGVLNPALFDHCGVQMRITFLKVRDYADIMESQQKKNFEMVA